MRAPITSKGRFYTIVSMVGVMGIQDLDRLCGQGLVLISENRVSDPGCLPKSDDVWRYTFRRCSTFDQGQPTGVARLGRQAPGRGIGGPGDTGER